jgi:hypothetical protein
VRPDYEAQLRDAGQLKNILAQDAETKRQERWHATRDAVLGGLIEKCALSERVIPQIAMDAALFADACHGPLVKP